MKISTKYINILYLIFSHVASRDGFTNQKYFRWFLVEKITIAATRLCDVTPDGENDESILKNYWNNQSDVNETDNENLNNEQSLLKKIKNNWC